MLIYTDMEHEHLREIDRPLYRATSKPVAGIEQEIGFQPVKIRQAHPLFDGMDQMPEFFQAHYWEVKVVPAGFDLLAGSDLCPVQAMGHRERPLFGTQFHPEAYDDRFRAGRKLLQNFFSLL